MLDMGSLRKLPEIMEKIRSVQTWPPWCVLHCLVVVAALIATTATAAPETKDGTVTPNFRDADLGQIAEAVSAVTGKTFVLDPHIHTQISMISSTPLNSKNFYEAFLAILQVYGYVAVPSGPVVKIVADVNARQLPSVDLPDHLNASSEEIVTQIIEVKNVAAAQLVPILRPMMPQYAQLMAFPGANLLIVSDHANNVHRITRIVQRVDQSGDQAVELIPLENASATETARVVNMLYQQAGAEGGVSVKVVADERSNNVLISGEAAQKLRLRALIASLDTPLKSTGDTRVRYLRFANAEKLAPKLKEQVTGIAQASAGSAGGAQASSSQAQAEKNALIWAEPETNALIITAPPRIMAAIMEIIDKVDIRRAQVLVEAVIVEVNADKTSDLGVNWAAWSKGSGTAIPVGGFIEPTGGTSLADLASTAQSIANGSSSTSTSSLTGTTLAIGKIAVNGINFAATLKALSGDANTNIVATPSAITLDNQEAELKVAQEVPIITGSYTSTGNTSSTSSSSVNPFQTVQRQEVGTILKVTPQIAAEGNSVVLKISVESSNVAASSVSTVDITTNKRTVATNILVEDGGIVVLGGLISDTVTRSEQRVPVLGSIPLIGYLFKTRDYSRTRNNLMIFIRPKILRTPEQTAIATDAKYNYMVEEEQKAARQSSAPLLPAEKPPALPPLNNGPP
jgi:general secretion pathway protein D